MLFVLLDSGAGAGLLVDRQLYRGSAGRVGESGHIRLPAPDGSTGAEVEEVIGRQAILRAYRSDADHDATWEDLLAAVDAGEPRAEHLRDRWQATLGWLTAALAWTLDPDVIVFGGPASALLQSDTTALHRSLRDKGPAGITNAWRLSSLGPRGTALGAVALSQRAFFAIPHCCSPATPVPAWRLPPNLSATAVPIYIPNFVCLSNQLL